MRSCIHKSGAHGPTGKVSVGLILAITLSVVLLALPDLSGGGSALAARPQDRAAPVDLNSASLEEVLALPIPGDLAGRIVEYRTYVRYFDNIFDVLDVEGMTNEIFAEIKPLVSTMPPTAQDASIARLSASYRQVQRYLGQEGSSEGLVDEYLDKMREPENVNELDLYDLMSYQNVSPVDAANIIKARNRLGKFDSARQLRRSEGLRYWAYRNLRDFVVYSEEAKQEDSKAPVTGYIQTRYWQTPFYSDDDELGQFASGQPRGRYTVDQVQQYKPGFLNKFRASVRGGWKVGLLTDREYGEQNWDETVKGYIGVSDKKLGGFRIKGAYVGNYRVAFGLGLVMDNTDYIHYRKTGYGFNKRLLGVHGDLSRSHEYSLTGAAVEGAYGPLNFTFFVSSEKKDGILNADGTINRYVTMQPRPDADWLEERVVDGVHDSGLCRDAFQEDLFGGNIKYNFAPGTYLGVTAYEAHYDRGFSPDEELLVTETDRLEARDGEIWNAYRSVFTNTDGSVDEYKWRRVIGYEGQAVIGNVAVQGEYAFVQDPRNSLRWPFDFFSTKNPDAYIVNAFTQWDNLHFLAIFRDYDVGYDNPYNRAFSNDNRYEMTLLDSPYRLNDDLYTWLETNTPQPKPEKGIFLETRYRISRQLTISGLQFDRWKRKTDGADLMRYTLKAEYQPIFNLRFRVRHRFSSRSEANTDDVRTYRNWETRWQMIALLSNYNRLAFTYMTSNVMFPARPRLSGTADASALDPAVGLAGDPSTAFEVRYEHNLTPGIKMSFASSIYTGFFWNFEGNEFVLVDGNGFRNWFKLESRVSDRLLFQLKVTRDHNMPTTYLDIREYGEEYGNEPDAQYVPKDDTIVRLQMDYTF